MKKSILLLLFLLVGITIFAQKLEKIKGSKIVITTERAFDTIKGIELHKNLDITIVKAEENKLVIFADDNLHDIVLTDINDGILDIDLSNKIIRKKKFELTLYLTNLEEVTLNDSSKLTNNEYFNSENVQIDLKDRSQGNLMFDASKITLNGDNHCKGELLLKGNTIKINAQENSKLNIGLSVDNLILNANQKSAINIEGKADKATITANNFTRIKASNCKIENAEIASDDNATLYVNVLKNVEIKASGKSKIYLFGNAKINLSDFKDNATLYKR